jgi:hypothetical protein
MNKKLLPLILILAVLFQACTGPRGRDGEPGLDGVNIVAQTFEVENVDFNTANEFRYLQTYASANLQDVRESDAVLIYILWDVTESGSPIWRLLPQAIDMQRGIVYNSDYTPTDFSVTIDAPAGFNMSSLAAEWTQNQTLRVVVIPSDFTARIAGEPVDYKDYNAVKKYFNLDESKIPTYTAR